MLFNLFLLTAPMAFGVYGGIKLWQALGWQPSLAAALTAFHNIGDEAGQTATKTDIFGIVVVYPFYRIVCGVRGTHPEQIEQIAKAAEPEKEDPVEKQAELILERRKQIRDELYTLHLPDTLAEGFTKMGTKLLYENYQTTPPPKEVVETLTKAFMKLTMTLPLLAPQPTVAAFLSDITSVSAAMDFFDDLKALFPQSYSLYLTRAEWGRYLTSGGTRKLDIAGFEQIGERDGRRHVRHNLGKYPELANIVVPLDLPQSARFEGTWIIAPPGKGKTTLLSTLLNTDLIEVSEEKACVIIMDSKGEFLDHVRTSALFAPGNALAGKLTLIEPSANLALNPLQLGATAGHTIDLLTYVFSALLETETTPLQATLFRAVLIAMRVIPGASFTTFRDFIRGGWEPYEQYILTLPAEDGDFFLKGEFDGKTYKGTREELLWRIRDLTTRVPMLREMFRSPTTKIDLGQLMDTPGVIIIDNSVAQLGETGSEFFSRFFIALILAAAQQRAGRPQSGKLPVYVYLDEAQTIIAKDAKVASIVQTCRSQKIAMLFAHQYLSDLKIEEIKSALGNCAIRFTNPDDDRKELAPKFGVEANTLKRIPKGQFALYVRDYAEDLIFVTVPNTPVSEWPPMKPEELEAIRADMRERYSFVPKGPPPEEPPEPSTTEPQQWGTTDQAPHQS